MERHLVNLAVESEASAKQLALLKRDYYVLENASNIALDPSKDEESKLKELMNATDDSRINLINLNTNWYEIPNYASLAIRFKTSLKALSFQVTF
mgnify:FL=1